MTKNNESKLNFQKLLVGHFIEEIPDNHNKKVAYVWEGEGIWEIRKLPLGTFTTHIHKFKTPGLQSTLEEGWELNVPKIPATLLDVTLSFFRQIYSKHSSEVFLQYFYDIDKKEYTIHCPQQSVGPASVNYKRDFEYEKGKILVFEIHSHGSMGAFFSGTDDRDEKDDRFFGVIGNIKNYYPDIKIRVSVGGRRKEISIEDIFNLEEGSYNVESFPAEWINRIKEDKVKVSVRNYRGRSRSNGRVYYPDDFDEDMFNIINAEKETWDTYKTEERLIERNGKLYNVINNGKEEIWEELNIESLDTSKYSEKTPSNKNNEEKNEESRDFADIYEDWRSYRW